MAEWYPPEPDRTSRMEVSVKARTAQLLAQSAATLFTRPGKASLQTALNCVLLIAVFIGVSGVAGCAGAPAARTRGATVSQDPPRPDDATPAVVSDDQAGPQDATRLAQEWGIEPLGINLSAAGYMLDFRYRIVDADKARAFTDRSVKAYLIDQTTGAKMYVPSPPKVGRLQQTTRRPRVGRVHFVLFANPGRSVKPGAKVTLVFGDCEIKDLTVDAQSPVRSATTSSGDQRVNGTL
jgi:hypothetical protein